MNFIIKLPPVSKKNSQQIFRNSVTGKPFITPSAKYKEYEKSALLFIKAPAEPIDYPVNVKCLFYMPTRRKCDLVNLQEAALDVLVLAGVLADDNCSLVASMDGSAVFYDKENPRTEIEIEKKEGRGRE